MTRTQLDDKYVKLVADEGKKLKDTRYNLESKEVACEIENEHFIEEVDE